ncbi:hypothetical protein TrVE_jg12429 [Triparma verrucosa]|uniref:Uncharacterized protein n=1 Tax=Triparma verrucosa TaxID=1606542 RepID=A0A9W7CG89_9STRA|nr:hypothetical protein TrVE_jg12429 [Triparma verrucosa]
MEEKGNREESANGQRKENANGNREESASDDTRYNDIPFDIFESSSSAGPFVLVGPERKSPSLFDPITGQDLFRKNVLVLYPRVLPPNKIYTATVIGAGTAQRPLRILYDAGGSEENISRSRIVEVLDTNFVDFDCDPEEPEEKKKRGRKGSKRRKEEVFSSPPRKIVPKLTTTYVPQGSPEIAASVSSRSLNASRVLNYAKTKDSEDREEFKERCKPVAVTSTISVVKSSVVKKKKKKKKKPVEAKMKPVEEKMKPVEAKKKPVEAKKKTKKRPLPQAADAPALSSSSLVAPVERKNKPRKPLTTLSTANSQNLTVGRDTGRPKRNASAMASFMMTLGEERIVF